MTETPHAALIVKLREAQAALSAAIDRQYNREPALKISIPAQPDRDTDLIIGAALREAIATLQVTPVPQSCEYKWRTVAENQTHFIMVCAKCAEQLTFARCVVGIDQRRLL